MENRDYIDLLRFFINKKVDEKKAAHEMLDRHFFESDELMSYVKSKTEGSIKDEKFEELFNVAIKEVRVHVQTSIAPSLALNSSSLDDDWLNSAKMKEIGWDCGQIRTYRDRYFTYLHKIGRSPKYIRETKRSSLQIVRKLKDPTKDHSFFSKGLVVGSVQSGKTANFNAVINSAIDVGYRLIIVLSGIMEDLRVQTQKRIEKEVVGKMIAGGKFIGVGEDSYSFGELGEIKDIPQIEIPTSIDMDFKKTLKKADFSLNNKNILICKKNTGVLKNLILWLNLYLSENTDISLLIVDDEADNASLNNMGYKGSEYATTINSHIRSLLALFNKKAYIGYTGTPFANVLGDRNEKSVEKWKILDEGETKFFDRVDNLFPSDFIELLFPPSNYIGAKHFFETRFSDVKKIEPLIPIVVNDYLNAFPGRVYEGSMVPTTEYGKGTRATRKEDNFPQFLPESLQIAIKCFVISIAIRLSRKSELVNSKVYQPHNTMLIHISRYTTWQERTKVLVVEYVKELIEKINNDSLSEKDSIYIEMERIWNKYYAYIIKNIWNYLSDDYEDAFLLKRTFSDIKPLLVKAIENVEVKSVNNVSNDSLEYPDVKACRERPKENEKKYIAIGGNRLSRGFTLEGLTINYFVRNTNFADTLFQMGRWFGYRPGYLDCCKLFATGTLLEKFDQTTQTIEDIEQRFIDMNNKPYPYNTPEYFALRVLNHPGVLKITRAQILKNSRTINCSYSDHLIQTTQFKIENYNLCNAWNSFNRLVKSIKDEFKPVINKQSSQIAFWEYKTDSIDKLFEFLRLPNTFDINCKKNKTTLFGGVIDFIRKCYEEGKLTNWSIVIKASGSSKKISQELNFPFEVSMTKRQGPKEGRWRDLFESESIFTAGGSSKNIFNGGNDFKIRLTVDQISYAEQKFRANRLKLLKEKHPDVLESHLDNEVRKATIPEKVYRHMMSDKEGILVIYLIDTEEIFKHNGSVINNLKLIEENINKKVPLIGYALGIPPIEGNISGEYLISKFNKSEEEYDEFDMELDND